MDVAFVTTSSDLEELEVTNESAHFVDGLDATYNLLVVSLTRRTFKVVEVGCDHYVASKDTTETVFTYFP